jgi:hypothetical protein
MNKLSFCALLFFTAPAFSFEKISDSTLHKFACIHRIDPENIEQTITAIQKMSVGSQRVLDNQQLLAVAHPGKDLRLSAERRQAIEAAIAVNTQVIEALESDPVAAIARFETVLKPKTAQ